MIRSCLIRSCLALLLFAFVGVTHGAVVQLDEGRATGIIGLNVEGVFYDVSFQNNFYISIWGYAPSTFGTLCTEPGENSEHPCGLDPSRAIPAVDAVNALFNSENISEILFDDGSVQESFDVAYLFDRLAESVIRGGFDGTNWTNRGDLGSGTPTVHPFAVFNPSLIPIPPALVLFPTALSALVWFRRKQA
jgi:hypothetical protein